MVLDADAIVLGGATAFMGWVAAYTIREIWCSPKPRPWRPKAVREAMRRAHLVGFAKFRGSGHVPGRFAPRRRARFDDAPLPMVLVGYFDEDT